MSMYAFIKTTSTVIPLPLRDVDTDQIIPARYLTSTSREGFAEGLFHNFREHDPHFPFNQEKYKNSSVLCADNNFGCGSSREHAAWALLGWGIKVILAPGFADIFFSNSAKNGLVLVKLDQNLIDDILKKAAECDYLITVDLEKQTVFFPDRAEVLFDFDPFYKECILKGYDNLDYILEHQQEIDEFKKRQGINADKDVCVDVG